MSLKKLIELQASINIAESLDDDHLNEIGSRALQDFLVDQASRTEYVDDMKEAIKIAKQVQEEKSYPWPRSSNVKYPLISSASIQFASRVYPEIVKGDSVVQVAIIGDDPDGQKADLAEKIGRQMSDQLLILSDEWEPGTDKLLHMLPILGTCFRKTYFHEITGHIRSEVITADELVVNNNIKSLEDSRRITHIIYQYKNDIQSRINAGLYCDVDLGHPDGYQADQPIKDAGYKTPPSDGTDYDLPYVILEQHRYLDLDEDGYQEPYIVTIEKNSGKVLRIVARFDLDGIKADSKTDKIIRIDPIHYFTSYVFIPDPTGGFYGIGFGQLLLPLNKMINTLLNQLIDSGTLANMNGGFFGRGVRFKNGKVTPAPGEWIPLEAAAGSSLKDNIIPFPFKEPSSVLYQLLGLLMQAGKELSSVSDAMQGQEQAQNVPATTILALIEQGNKVFSSIQKRLYRSFKLEFQKIFRLNRLFLDTSAYNFNIAMANPPKSVDYARPGLDVRPVADPTVSSETHRMARLQALMQIYPELSPNAKLYAQQMYLKSLQFNEKDIQNLMIQPQGPSPDQIKLQAEVQKITAEAQAIPMKAHADLLDMQLKYGDQELKLKQLEISALQAMAQVKQAEAQSLTAVCNAETSRISAAAEYHVAAGKAYESEGQLTQADAQRYEQAADELVDPPMGNNNEQNNSPALAPMEKGPNNQAPYVQPGPNEEGLQSGT